MTFETWIICSNNSTMKLNETIFQFWGPEVNVTSYHFFTSLEYSILNFLRIENGGGRMWQQINLEP